MNMIWFNHQDNFKDIMHEILKSNELADVTLVCDDNKEFKVHKIVVIACNSVFKSIFHVFPQIYSLIYFTGVQQQEIESLFGLQKMYKMIYFKKLEFHDLAAHWGWFPKWLGSAGYHQTP